MNDEYDVEEEKRQGYCGVPFDSLAGEEIASVVVKRGYGWAHDEVVFVTVPRAEDRGDVKVYTSYRMFHGQDCCESVSLNDVVGDLEDIHGVILSAEETTSEAEGKQQESATWTFYSLRTVKGAVTLRWFGESNGYYSEEVEFYRKRWRTRLVTEDRYETDLWTPGDDGEWSWQECDPAIAWRHNE